MMEDEISAAIEVIATMSDDGRIRTCSFSIPEPSLLSLADGCEGDPPLESNYKQSEKPVLVPVGSTFDSEEDSTSSEDEHHHPREKSMSTRKVLPNEMALPSVNTVATMEDRNAYDCLSDQITSMFCSSEHLCLHQPPTLPLSKSSGESRPLAGNEVTCTEVTCTEVGCTEYQLKDFLNSDGANVFSQLQFWLTPSQEETVKVVKRQGPHNRSSASRKRRSKHVETMWNSWYGSQSIPLERSKSLPFEQRQRLSRDSPEAAAAYLNDICYDSDPEQEYHQRVSRGDALKTPDIQTDSFRDRRPLSIQTIKEDESCFLGTAQVPLAPRSIPSLKQFDFRPCRNTESPPPRSSQFGGRGNDKYTLTTPTEDDLMSPEGEPLLRSFIQEATNTKLPLVWHRRTHGTESITRKVPLAVTCAFEVGAHLNNLVVQPKFTWSPKFEPNLPHRRIQLSGTEPDSIELLSIIRVVKPTKLNRNLYPFARLDRTCCITTNDEKFPYLVLEASSTRERDWLVNAMKMIVARLASIIIVRDEAMLLDFFTPYAALMQLLETTSSTISEEHQEQQQERDGASMKPTMDSNGELQLVSYGRIQ